MDKFEIIEKKVVAIQELMPKLAYWKFKGMKVVFTNGCFDIIHRGHVEYLAKAASLGDVLILGLNSDSSVKKIKGEDRPINDEKSRALIVSSLKVIDNVILFEEDTPYNLIDAIKPDVLVKGGDYKAKDIVGYDIVKQNGGDIITIDFVEGFSTTKIINRI
jgi:rfaE bifunctional protein nucleotidyltransferase chain/domain